MSEVAGPQSPVELNGPSVVDLSLCVAKMEEETQPEELATNAAEVSADSREALNAHEEVRDQPMQSGSPVGSPKAIKEASSGNEPPEESNFASPPGNRFVSYIRGRVVSLDRGHELRRVVSLDRGRELLADLEGMNSSSDLSNAADEFAARSISYPNEEEDSIGSNSSDGQSSYFAKHLPSPKSGRRWSFSDAASTSSAPARAGPYAQSSNCSDASLSFSDDEEDDYDVRPGMKIITSKAPMPPPPVRRDGSDELPPYPQRITRIHSVNSLVSSSSDDQGSTQEMPHPPPRTALNGSSSSVGSGNSTSSDPSVRAELRHVAVPKTRRSVSSGTSGQMSGRLAPISGAHYPAFMGGFINTPPSVPQGSPPPIYQGQCPPNAQDVAHPQPMTQEQLAAWLAAGNNMLPAPFVSRPFIVPQGYGTTALMTNPHGMRPQLGRSRSDPVNSSVNSAESGNMTLTMVYSEDEETEESTFGQKDAGNAATLAYEENKGASFDNKMSEVSGFQEGSQRSDPLGGMGIYGPDHQQEALKSSSRSQDPGSGGGDDDGRGGSSTNKGFKVYPQRWLMLTYMSVLNLLSDWTCYSVAPISLLTSEAFGRINPEQLVVVFLGANAIATACEPIILSRLGLRRTVVFGALLLMLGSIVKSGGLPPIVQPTLTKGKGEWRVYLGFFLVGLSQPLYQCTPALLSASWFPQSERTMATGVALNANQLGIGFAFIFGTLLVANSDDIVRYFGLLSFISTVTFLGCLVQFDDAPPTPPSDTARVIRGTFEMKLPPAVDSIWKSVRSFASQRGDDRSSRDRSDSNHSGSRKSQSSSGQGSSRSGKGRRRRTRSDSGRSGRKPRRSSSTGRKSTSESPQPSSRKQAQAPGAAALAGSSARRRSNATSRKKRTATSESGLTAAPVLAPPPSPASTSICTQSALEIAAFEREAYNASVIPPSRMMPGPVGPVSSASRSEDESSPNDNDGYSDEQRNQRTEDTNEASDDQGFPSPEHYVHQFSGASMPIGYQQQWQQAYWDPRYQQAPFQYHAYQQYPGYQQQGYYMYPPGYYPQMFPQVGLHDYQQAGLPKTSDIDEGAEPTVTITPHHLDINIRDDQIILSARACLSRPGFIHALVSFTVSGIVINTLSTFMDYLVRLNGAGRQYTGIVGGTFQFVIMISSLIIGKQTDRTRAYYSVILAMLVLGAFGLAECGVSLDADRGSNLRWTLIVVAALVGPLQPVSTELGVDVAYPLSENTVLVIQQLFANLLSAMFIPFFKALKDVGTVPPDEADVSERPQYTFSFYLLIVLHAGATVFFATFNGRYLRYEQELVKKAQEEAKMMFSGPTAFHPVHDFDYYRPLDQFYEYDETAQHGTENQPLINTVV